MSAVTSREILGLP